MKTAQRYTIFSMILLVVCATAQVGQAAYVDEVDALSPIAYWRLGESAGTTASDRSGNTLHGTYDGATLGALGVIGGDSDTAADFDGINDMMTSASSSLLRLTGDVSVSVWINVDSFPVTEGIKDPVFTITADASGSGEAIMAQISFNQGGDPVYTHQYGLGGGSTQQKIFTEGNLSTDEWYNVVMTRNTTTKVVSVYIDGVLLDTYTYSNQAEGYNNGTLNLGKYGSDKFDGSIDELAVFDYELTGQEISDLYDAGNPVPEPATIVMLGLGCLVLVRRCK